MKKIINFLKQLRTRWILFLMSSWLLCICIQILFSIILNLILGFVFDVTDLSIRSFVTMAIAAIVSGTIWYGLYKEDHRRLPKNSNK